MPRTRKCDSGANVGCLVAGSRGQSYLSSSFYSTHSSIILIESTSFVCRIIRSFLLPSNHLRPTQSVSLCALCSQFMNAHRRESRLILFAEWKSWQLNFVFSFLFRRNFRLNANNANTNIIGRIESIVRCSVFSVHIGPRIKQQQHRKLPHPWARSVRNNSEKSIRHCVVRGAHTVLTNFLFNYFMNFASAFCFRPKFLIAHGKRQSCSRTMYDVLVRGGGSR